MGIHMATQVKRWTLEELHSLPDDGNKYELVRGELFVAPPPNPEHQGIIGALNALLVPYVAANDLGIVDLARSVLRFQGSEVEPDLMVRERLRKDADWDRQPIPILVVEVLSPSTRRRDQSQKRALYTEAGVGEYWIIDPDRRTITVARRGAPDQTLHDALIWHPTGAAKPLEIQLADVLDCLS